jgi:exosortase E/protease (VPEID-CTERM system)
VLLELNPIRTPRGLFSRGVVRWVGLLGLLVAEMLVVIGAADGVVLVADSAWWQNLAGQAKLLSWVGTASLTGLLVFAITQLRHRRAAPFERIRRPRLAWPALAAHALFFVVFWQMTELITERHLQQTPQAGAWVVLWCGAGLATLLTWGVAALPGMGPGVVLAAVAAGVTSWVVGGLTLHFWAALKYPTFAVVKALLGLLFADVVCQPDTEILGTGSVLIQVTPACSGCEGIGLVWVTLGIYLWCYRQELRWPHALLLLPLGSALIWVANAVRITTLVAVGVYLSPEIAISGFHSQAGWLTFNFISLGLIGATQYGRLFSRSPASSAEALPGGAYLVPFLALIAATMIASAFSAGGGFDILYPLRVLTVLATLVLYRRAYAAWDWSWSWQAPVLGALAFVIWMALEVVRGTPSDAGLGAGLANLPRAWGIVWLLGRIVGSVVMVPLAEELAFRGYLMRRLVRADFERVAYQQVSWLAVIVSSVIFGLLHSRWYAGMIVGVLYALQVRRSGRLNDAVVAHATTNALIVAYVVGTGNWSLWC